MSAASRRKGLTGEREVRQTFAANGFEMRGLEGSGDWLAFKMRGGTRLGEPGAAVDIEARYHVECKRYHDRARFPEWWEQAASEAPQGVPPLLCTRADRGEWLVTLRLSDLLDVIA